MDQLAANSQLLPERARLLLRYIAEEFPVLGPEQASELFRRESASEFRRGMDELARAGFLAVRATSEANRLGPGYYLGPNAAETFCDPAERAAVRSGHEQIRSLSLSEFEHRMLLNAIHIRFLAAARDYPQYRLLTWVDKYSAAWGSVERYGVPTGAEGYAECLVLLQLDGLFPFFVETDLREQSDRALAEKIAHFVEYAESGTYSRRFAAEMFQVLFITTRPDRVVKLLEAAEAHTDPDAHQLFWVASWESFKSRRVVEPYWFRPHRSGRYRLSACAFLK